MHEWLWWNFQYYSYDSVASGCSCCWQQMIYVDLSMVTSTITSYMNALHSAFDCCRLLFYFVVEKAKNRKGAPRLLSKICLPFQWFAQVLIVVVS